MKIAILVKQVPTLGESRLDDSGRLVRSPSAAELNPHCRRAISKGVSLARLSGGSTTVITLGPPQARHALIEALDYGADFAAHICDQAFAGSDTLATARALTAAIDLLGPFDLVLTGLSSADSGTGHVGAQLAQLLGRPFLDGVRELDIRDGVATARCERDDGWRRVRASLPLVLACAERLCEAAKRPDAVETAEIAARIRMIRAAELGVGPWGQRGSPTRVGTVLSTKSDRRGARANGDVNQLAAHLLEAIGRAADAGSRRAASSAPGSLSFIDVAVLGQPGRDQLTRELLGGARSLTYGQVTLLAIGARMEPGDAHAWGADEVVYLHSREEPAHEVDVAEGVSRWRHDSAIVALLVPSTSWGREVAARVAASERAGLVGDAIGLRLRGGSLVADKPVDGTDAVAAVHIDSLLQIATVRPGVLKPAPTRQPVPIPARRLLLNATCPLTILEQSIDATIDELARAPITIGLGAGVPPDGYPLVEEFADLVGAQIAATRKVTDRSWKPHSRQVGTTGLSIAPELYLAIGLSGAAHHVTGVRRAGTILAINNDPNAAIFRHADLGFIADWREILTATVARCRGKDSRARAAR